MCACLGQWGNCRLEQGVVLVVWFSRLCLRVGQMQILQLLQMKFFYLRFSISYSHVLAAVVGGNGPHWMSEWKSKLGAAGSSLRQGEV